MLEQIRKKQKEINERILNLLEVQNNKHKKFSEQISIDLNKGKLLEDYLANTELKNIPIEILRIPGFKNFTHSFIYILEKGNSQAYASNNFNQTEKLSSEQFNKAFNSLKKIKGKVFDSNRKNLSALNIPGTFLAHGFTTSKLQGILTLSRHDFLQPDLYEINFFKKFCQRSQTNNLQTLNLSEDNSLSLLPKLAPFFFEKLLITKGDHTLINFGSEDPSRVQRDFHQEFSFKYQAKLQKTNELAADSHHQQRLKLIGELFNTLKHELSNPIFGMKLYTGIVRQKVKVDHHMIIDQIEQSVERCESILDNLGKLYNQEKKLSPVELKSVIDQTLTLTKSELRSIQFQYRFEPDEQIVIHSHSSLIIQVLFNLIINACYELRKFYAETPQSAKLSLEVTHENNFIYIQLADNGPGIAAEYQEQIFQPFFTTKKTGTGLGLAISKKLCNQLGADLYLKDNNQMSGACFVLKLPLKTDKL